jgi:hypothetical protein
VASGSHPDQTWSSLKAHVDTSMAPPTSQSLKTHSVAPINGLNLTMSSPQRLQSPEGSSSILTKPQSPAEQPLATTAVTGLTHHQQPLTASQQQQQQQQQQQLMLLQALQMHGWPPGMCSAAASIPTSGNIDVQQHSQMIATAQQQPQLQLQQQQQQQQQEALQEQQQQQQHHQLLMQNQTWMQHQQQQQARVCCLCSVG